MLLEHYILTQDPCIESVFLFIKRHGLRSEIHLNRTRFWIESSLPIYSEFVLRYGHSCPLVDPSLDPATGLPLQP